MKITQPKWTLVLTVIASFCLAAGPLRAQDDTATNNTAASTNETSTASNSSTPRDDGRIQRDDVVKIGANAHLDADEDAGDVVAVFGSTKVLGHARGSVVAVFGDVDLEGESDGDVVAVFGNLHAGPKAVVHGDAVSVGGSVTREPGAKFSGRVQETQVDLPGLRNPLWLTHWFSECVLKLRPLSLRVPWVWGVTGIFFLLYALIALAFPNAVRATVTTLAERPVTTLAVGIFGQLGWAILALLLVCTVIGILIVPVLQVAVIVAFLVGKVAIMEAIGGGLGRSARVSSLQQPFAAFVLGAVIVTLTYLVPILGLLSFTFLSAWGFGAATTAAYSRWRRERPPKSPPTPTSPTVPPSAPPHGFTMPVAGAAMAATATPVVPATANLNVSVPTPPSPATPAPVTHPPPAPTPEPAPFTPSVPLAIGLAPAFTTSSASAPAPAPEPTPIPAPSPEPASAAAPPLPPPPPPPNPPRSTPPFTPLPIPTPLAFPRAGFFMRMAAGALDLILLIIPGHIHFLFFCLLTVAYFTAMLAWKGTTIGGIILRLHVVRADGQPLTLIVALVRALAGMFSVFVLFLGFFWIAWDPEKQGWHDKIAGTVVVRLPHAPALVML